LLSLIFVYFHQSFFPLPFSSFWEWAWGAQLRGDVVDHLDGDRLQGDHLLSPVEGARACGQLVPPRGARTHPPKVRVGGNERAAHEKQTLNRHVWVLYFAIWYNVSSSHNAWRIIINPPWLLHYAAHLEGRCACPRGTRRFPQAPRVPLCLRRFVLEQFAPSATRSVPAVPPPLASFLSRAGPGPRIVRLVFAL